jgi:hypothetical protein
MADVFISYAKADRSLALKLAAMLEAEGWKVWWDTSLTIGDDFRNEIMTELGRARAVIVIWTDASVKSDWVRSEAGRAQADRKLIPVKLAHLTYKDLPPPFDVLHTENVTEDDKIKAAVVAQLAKPAVEPTPLALLTKGFRYELLTWFGIVGGAMTLFTAIAFALVLAPWARVLVQKWRAWTHGFWVWAFGWLGIHLPPEWTPVLSFLLFGSLLTIGQAIQFRRTIKSQPILDKYQGKSFRLTSWRTFFCTVLTLIGTILWLAIAYPPRGILALQIGPHTIVYNMIVILFVPQFIILVLFARHRLHAAVAACLMALFFSIITLVPQFSVFVSAETGRSSEGDLGWVLLFFSLIGAMSISPVILLSVAPAKAVSRRLIFLAIGLVLLIVLNELSNLGFDISVLKPPS